MSPRKTSQQGASARTPRARASARTTTRSSGAGRASASARPKKAAKPSKASPKQPTRPSTKKATASKGSGRELARHWSVPLVAAALVALMLGLGYYPAARVQYREMRQKAKLEQELRGLRARNARLRQQVARLKTPEGLEDLARTQLGLVKKGEHVAVIVDESEQGDGSKAAPSAAPKLDDAVPTAAQTEDTGWTAFLDAFFGVEQ